MGRRVRALAALGSVLAFAGVLLSVTAAPVAAAGATIEINTEMDVTGDDGLCSLREAIIAANTDTASGVNTGECAAGSATEPDSLVTTDATTEITLGSPLPAITGDLSLDGGTFSLGINGNSNTAELTIDSGAVTLSNAAFTNSGGGAIKNHGTLTLDGVYLIGNHGTAVVSDGPLTITGSQIYNNHAGSGSAAIEASGRLRVSTSWIDSNVSGSAPGTIYYSGRDGRIVGSTLSNNKASIAGGAIELAGILTVANSTIANNSALQVGGGIAVDPGETALTLINVTVTGNKIRGSVDPNEGGGLWGADSATLVNTIIAGNTAVTDPDVSGTPASTTASLIGVPAGKTLAAIFLPGLGNPVDATNTLVVRDLVPGPNNPAVDTGDDAACAAAPVNGTDEIGRTRPIGAHCDIGAVEAAAFNFTPPPTLGGGSGAPAHSNGGSLLAVLAGLLLGSGVVLAISRPRRRPGS